MSFSNIISDSDHNYRQIRTTVLTVSLSILLTATLFAQNEPLDWRIENVAGLRVEEVKQFLDHLENEVASRDSKSVCARIQYPLRIASMLIRNSAACVASYNTIFNKKVAQAIAAQKFEELFVNSRGVMIGSGQVWLGGICKDKTCEKSELKIISVNN